MSTGGVHFALGRYSNEFGGVHFAGAGTEMSSARCISQAVAISTPEVQDGLAGNMASRAPHVTNWGRSIRAPSTLELRVIIARARSVLGVSVLLGLCGCEPDDARDGPGGEGPTSDGDESAASEASLACVGPDRPLAGGVYECSEPSHQHQKELAVCERSPGTACEDPGLGDSECSTDQDCGFALCRQYAVGCFCVPTCSVAEDCGPGRTCYCGGGTGGFGRCVPANCRTDADCDGSLCAVSEDACGQGLYCTTAADECERSTTSPCTYDVDAGKWVASGADGCP
jgi:hypothetical protein